jgi:predicted outer membrane protein
MTQRVARCAVLGIAVTLSSVTYGLAAAPAQQPGSPAVQAARPDAREFINQMSIAGMAEVQLGMLASERGTNADVKAFGQMMVKDHSQANKELSQIAAQLKLQPPKELDAKHRDLANRLSKLQGAEFDREYMTAMVQGHEEVLEELRAFTGNQLTTNAPAERPRASAGQGEQTSAQRGAGSAATGTTGGTQGEQALIQWGTKTVPVVQQHLERARSILAMLK